MKTIISLFTFVLLVSLGTSCTRDSFCIEATGPTISKTVGVPFFTSVNLDMHANVFIVEGPHQGVTIEAAESVVDLVLLEVHQGQLTIFTDDCIKHGDIRIFITMEEVDELLVQGSGNIRGENTFTGHTVRCIIDGSGDIDLSLDVHKAEVVIDGSGDVLLEGDGDILDVIIDGSGDVLAFPFVVNRSYVLVDGSGDVETHVLDYLKVTVEGSGDVFFRGYPDISTFINGSGDVVDVN